MQFGYTYGQFHENRDMNSKNKKIKVVSEYIFFIQCNISSLLLKRVFSIFYSCKIAKVPGINNMTPNTYLSKMTNFILQFYKFLPETANHFYFRVQKICHSDFSKICHRSQR